jgi:hypothetical protein
VGVLSDFIIADRTEAAAINQAKGGHLEQWTCLESKGIDSVKLGTLWAILSRTEYDPAFMDMDVCVLDQPSDEGPWLMLVPSKLVSAVAALDGYLAKSVAREWGKSEEFQMGGWSEDAVVEWFQDFIAFAQTAQTAGKDLLLWMSL